MDYDVAIIGAGISGLMAAYRIASQSDKRVCIIEKGRALRERVCPILHHSSDGCVRCKSCAVMEGIAGAGAFSDGKYNITTEFGGWLPLYKDAATVLSYIEAADEILVKCGADVHRYPPNDELKKRCLQHDLHMLQAQVKHLGTDANFFTMEHLVEAILALGVTILTQSEVVDVDRESHAILIHDKDGDRTIAAEAIIFAVGRAGSQFFASWCEKNEIQMFNNQVDIGVRVELPALIWEEFAQKIYEPKILHLTKDYGDTTRMFCFNPCGEVVTENTGGVLTVNGHSYKEPERRTENSNFALLSTIRFTQPFHKPIDYARSVAALANMIAGGGVLVQRLGDLEKGRRTDESRLQKSTVRPTLRGAVAGDLSLCLPKRQLDNILQTLHALDRIAPGTANYDTLLYGIECKYYSARPDCDENFCLCGTRAMYAVGDGAGFTRSLSQAAAQGLMVADYL